jgi:5-methyltetrahydrofolate--homocysteine methyltransferase
VLRDIPLQEVFDLLDLDELYRLQWGARGSGPEFDRVVRDDLEPVRKRLEADALASGWLRPQAVYGYFPVQSVGNELIVYDPEKYAKGGETVEIERFKFPRMEGRERLCLADYYRSVESGEVDVAAVQVVTVGTKADEKFAKLQAANEYTEAFFTHGLAVETAEAVAEWMHRHEKAELRIPPGRGKRYSWGYPACPDLDDHQVVFRLLPAEKELGISLSSAFQLMPEQSTAALITHHPQAKYYAVRANAS